MKVNHDARTDTLSIVLNPASEVAESDEDKPGIILDYDEDGDLVSLEILDASQRVGETRRIEFELVSDSPHRGGMRLAPDSVRR